jgi:hypothetical protein
MRAQTASTMTTSSATARTATRTQTTGAAMVAHARAGWSSMHATPSPSATGSLSARASRRSSPSLRSSRMTCEPHDVRMR